MQVNREEMVERIAIVIRENGSTQPLQGLHLGRLSAPLEKIHDMPCLGSIFKISKQICLG